MRRSPNLDAVRVRAVVDAVRRMPGRPTWARIEREVGEILGHPYTRQALEAKPAIKAAYLERKLGTPAVAGGKRLSARARDQLDRDRRQREQIAELESTVDELNERIVVLLHNAYLHGIAREMLEQDLPAIDRAASGPVNRKMSRRRRARGG